MNLACPYCENEIEDPDDCYEEGVTYEHECPACEKSFVFYVKYSRDYAAHKADCLNGGDHDYKNTATIPAEYSRMRCTMCDHETPLPKGSNVKAQGREPALPAKRPSGAAGYASPDE